MQDMPCWLVVVQEIYINGCFLMNRVVKCVPCTLEQYFTNSDGFYQREAGPYINSAVLESGLRFRTYCFTREVPSPVSRQTDSLIVLDEIGKINGVDVKDIPMAVDYTKDEAW